MLLLCTTFEASAQITPHWIFTAQDRIDSRATIGTDGTIYLSSRDGHLYAINADGSERWRFEANDRISESPAIGADGTVYVNAWDENLYALNPNGSLRWMFRTHNSIFSSVIAGTDGTVYTGASGDDEHLYALNPDGSERWRFATKGGAVPLAVGDDGTVYVSGDTLYALNPDGSVRWRSDTINSLAGLIIGADGTLYVSSGNLYALNPDGSVRWRFVTDSGASTPAVGSDGTVYVSSSTLLYAVDSAGIERWRFRAPQAITSPTVAADGTIYAGADDKYLYAIDALGVLRWRFRTSAPDSSSFASLPAIGADGTVYVGSSDGRFYALPAAPEGIERWRFTTGIAIYSSPAIGADGTVYIGSFDQHLYALNPDGSERWRFLTNGVVSFSAPAVGADGTVYAGSDDLYAINANGSLRWRFRTDGEVDSTPAVGADSTIYVGSGEQLYAINADGSERWRFDTGEAIISSPALGADGAIYLGSSNGILYAINADGSERWRFRGENADAILSNGFFSPVIGKDGTIYVGYSGLADYLYAFNADGSERWRFTSSTFSIFGSSPSIAADGTLYIMSNDDQLYAVSPEGGVRWRFPIEPAPGISAEPTVGADGTIYAGSDDGALYAVNADGSERWRFQTDLRIRAATAVGTDGTLYIGSTDGTLFAVLGPYPTTRPWAMAGHDRRRTRRSRTGAPRLSATATASSVPPTWVWETSLEDGTGLFRYAINNDNLSRYGIETLNTVVTLSPPFEEGAHTLTVQECLQATDRCQQWSAANSVSINIDTRAPLTSITTVDFGDEVRIGLGCVDRPDSGSGCSSTFYSLDNNTFLRYAEPVTIDAEAEFYFYSVDRFGNTEAVKTRAGAFTSLSLTSSRPTLLQNDTLDITGKLTRRPDNGQDLSALPLQLVVVTPSGEIRFAPLETSSSAGQFKITDLGGFTEKGVYTLQARFNGTSQLSPSDSAPQTILVGSSAGYAIVVQGKLDDDPAESSAHLKTTDRVVSALRQRGFVDDNIRYFRHGAALAADRPTRANIEEAITRWAPECINSVAAPLFIVMVDHGGNQRFYLDGTLADPVIVSDDHLHAWLSKLEDQIADNPAALAEPRVVIIGTCFSGSFIPTLSKPGRILITSSAADEESFKGPLESDNVRVGEYFLEVLFQELQNARTLRQAFLTATAQTEQWTRLDGAGAGDTFGLFDNALQHPQLDDNGDRVGSNDLSATGDGQRVAQLRLGVGVTNAFDELIVRVHDPVYLDARQNSAELDTKITVEVIDNNQVDNLAALIRKPSARQTNPERPRNTQLISQFDDEQTRFLFTPRDDTHTWASVEPLDALFSEPGSYEIFILPKI